MYIVSENLYGVIYLKRIKILASYFNVIQIYFWLSIETFTYIIIFYIQYAQ